MKLLQLICLSSLMLFTSSCAQLAPGDSSKLTPAQRTNEVAEANLHLGIAYLQQGEYEKSLEKLNRALEADSKYPPTYNALGLLYQKLGKSAEAEKNFKHALSLSPNDSLSLNNYGQFLCSSTRYTEAGEVFDKAAANPLNDAPEIALTNAGVCKLKQDEPDRAEEYFRKALDKNPRVPLALLQMTQLSYDQANYLSARGYLQRYLEVAKHTPTTLWLGILIEKELGDKNTLSSYALQLKNNYPDSREAALLKESNIK